MTNLPGIPQFGELVIGGKEMLFTPGAHIKGLDIRRVVRKGKPQLIAPRMRSKPSERINAYCTNSSARMCQCNPQSRNKKNPARRGF